MHRGSCITRRKASARKARKPDRTSYCQRPHKHAEQLLLSRIQPHAEGDESATRHSSIHLIRYGAADVNLHKGKRGGYFHNEGLPGGNRALSSEAAATLVPVAMSIYNEPAFYFPDTYLMDFSIVPNDPRRRPPAIPAPIV